jgi:hypothetical protein
MLAYDPASNPLNNNEWAFPLTECFHIGAMAFSIGTIVLVDLRLMGLGLRRRTAAQLLADSELWTLGGLMVAITTGLLIFSTDPKAYVRNEVFLFKMTALVAAIVYNYTIHRGVVTGVASGFTRTLVAGASVVLWCSIVFAGIFTAFI